MATLAVALSATAFGLAGCGGDSEPTTATRPTEQPTAEVQGVTAQPTAVPVVPTPTPAPASGGGVHVVAAGELLSTIAAQYGVTVDAIVAANGISDPNLVYVGQELIIPSANPAPADGATATDGTATSGATTADGSATGQ